MPDMSLGDTAQVRTIVEQVLSAERELRGERMDDDDIESKIAQAVAVSEAKLNKRVLLAIFANAVPLLIGAFFLGGLWVKFANVPDVLNGRSAWMRNTENRMNSVETHLEQRDGYKRPPAMVLPD